MATKTAEYFLERSTAGTHLYKEMADPPVLSRNIYVLKSIFKGEKTPEKLRVTVESID